MDDLPQAPPADPTTDDIALNGECLLATVGLRQYLARQPERVSAAARAAARDLPETIAGELRAFLDGEETKRPPGRPAKARPFDYLATIKQLAQPMEPADVERIVGAHQDGRDALDLLVPLTRAVAYLNGAAPRRYRQTLMTMELVRPSDQEVQGFARVFAAVDDPMVILRRLRAGALLPDEVQAVASVYPALYARLQAAVGQALGDRLARNPKARLTYRQETLLRTLTGIGPQDPTLTAAMQASYGQQGGAGAPQAPPPPSRPLQVDASSYRSAGERAEAGGR